MRLYPRFILFSLIHGHCVSRKARTQDGLPFTWWGHLLHVKINNYPRLRKALLRWL